MRQKKLQVFISSTFHDLKEERQAAVEAILSCGHIPAGMELFSAGDESQMKVIHRWIEESDVFLLILGGRYGSLESETGKSYTHLEYEYAAKLNKPLFAVVVEESALEDKLREKGSSAIERDNPQKLKEFKQNVLTKLVKFYSDGRDIKLAIHETMAEFNRRKELIGWVRADQEVNTDNLAEEMARLAKENSQLREKISNEGFGGFPTFLGLTLDELVNLLKSQKIDIKKVEDDEIFDKVDYVRTQFKSEEYNLLHFFWAYKDSFAQSQDYDEIKDLDQEMQLLENYGILVYDIKDRTEALTEEGRRFYLKLMIKFSSLI